MLIADGDSFLLIPSSLFGLARAVCVGSLQKASIFPNVYPGWESDFFFFFNLLCSRVISDENGKRSQFDDAQSELGLNQQIWIQWFQGILSELWEAGGYSFFFFEKSNSNFPFPNPIGRCNYTNELKQSASNSFLLIHILIKWLQYEEKIQMNG